MNWGEILSPRQSREYQDYLRGIASISQEPDHLALVVDLGELVRAAHPDLYTRKAKARDIIKGWPRPSHTTKPYERIPFRQDFAWVQQQWSPGDMARLDDQLDLDHRYHVGQRNMVNEWKVKQLREGPIFVSQVRPPTEEEIQEAKDRRGEAERWRRIFENYLNAWGRLY